MAQIEVDVRGETCPVPLVEMRKAVLSASKGDTIRLRGTHPASMQEIPMAVEALGITLVAVEGVDTDWTITIER